MHGSIRRHPSELGAPARGRPVAAGTGKRSGNHWGAPSSDFFCRQVAAMFSTLDWAVKGATGSSSSTFPNVMERGRPAAADNPFGDWKFDYREFHPIYPPPAQNADADGTQASAAPGVPTLETEIAALVQEAQEKSSSARGRRVGPPGGTCKAKPLFPAPPANFQPHCRKILGSRLTGSAWNGAHGFLTSGSMIRRGPGK